MSIASTQLIGIENFEIVMITRERRIIENSRKFVASNRNLVHTFYWRLHIDKWNERKLVRWKLWIITKRSNRPSMVLANFLPIVLFSIFRSTGARVGHLPFFFFIPINFLRSFRRLTLSVVCENIWQHVSKSINFPNLLFLVFVIWLK